MDDRRTESPAPRPARAILLQDRLGCVQAVVDKQALLDLDAVHKLTGRQLSAVPLHQMATVTRRQKLQQMTEVPSFFLAPTVIDRQISNSNELHHEIVQPDEISLESLTNEAFMQALRDRGLRIQTGDIAIAEKTLRTEVGSAASDTAAIRSSLENFTELRLRQRLEETLEIPPLPATADRIIRLRDNPNASSTELTRIVESDPGLAAQVVSWAASPYYAAPGKISSVHDAIVRVLGFDMVSNLAVGLILGRNIALPKEKVEGMTPYWIQAVYVATGAEALFRLLPPRQRPRQGLLYLAGLLHNFGYLILAHTFPPHFSSLCRYVEANPAISHVAIEHHLLGVSREQLGAWLMQCWNMPEELAVALRYQHDARYSDKHAAYANLVYMTTRLLREQGIGDAPPEPIPEALFRQYGLYADEARLAIAHVAQSADIRHMAEQLASASS